MLSAGGWVSGGSSQSGTDNDQAIAQAKAAATSRIDNAIQILRLDSIGTYALPKADSAALHCGSAGSHMD